MEKYVKIVEEMLARNEKVTLQEVRRIAGKGSYSTISDAIKFVLNRGLIPMEVSGPVPEALIDVTKDLWQEACRIASEVVASERFALHSARAAGQENLRELTSLADLLAIQVDELNMQIESLGIEKGVAEQRAHEAEISLKAMQDMLKQLGLKPAKTQDKQDQMASEV
jgi:hypothetical protein